MSWVNCDGQTVERISGFVILYTEKKSTFFHPIQILLIHKQKEEAPGWAQLEEHVTLGLVVVSSSPNVGYRHYFF